MKCTVTDLVALNDTKVRLTGYQFCNRFSAITVPSTINRLTVTSLLMVFLQVILTQLKDKHIQTLEDAMIESKDREKWRVIVRDPSLICVYGYIVGNSSSLVVVVVVVVVE